VLACGTGRDNRVTELVERTFKAIKAKFGDPPIKFDVTNSNAARIWKLYGTRAAKGDDTLERPHRLARILALRTDDAQFEDLVITREQLEELVEALTSEGLAQLSDFAERLFWGLTTIADDFGRFAANPAVIQGRTMPLVTGITPKKILAAMQELQSVGAIQLYEVESKSYGYFVGWDKYQHRKLARYSPCWGCGADLGCERRSGEPDELLSAANARAAEAHLFQVLHEAQITRYRIFTSEEPGCRRLYHAGGYRDRDRNIPLRVRSSERIRFQSDREPAGRARPFAASQAIAIETGGKA
jgi:hypothetical protein